MKNIKKLLTDHFAFIVVIIFSIVILVYKIDKPFWGHHDWGGSYWGNVAVNYLHYPFNKSYLAMIENIEKTNTNELSFTFHYSPLFPLTGAAFIYFFGDNEWGLRLQSVVFTCGSIIIFYVLCNIHNRRKTGLIGLCFWIISPLYIYFGKSYIHEHQVLFLGLLSILCYSLKRNALVLIFIFLAQQTSWPGYFLVPAITVHQILAEKRENIIFILLMWLLAFVSFGLLLSHNKFVTGSFVGGGLKEIFLQRTEFVSMTIYIPRIIRWLWLYFGPMVPLSFLWVIFNIKRQGVFGRLVFLLLVFALFYPIVFREPSFRHDYLIIYFWPFFAIASALLMYGIRNKKFRIIMIMSVFIYFIFSRGEYTQSLLKSDIYKESVKLGKFVKENTKAHDKVKIVIQDNNVGFDGWYVAYYARRNFQIVYDDTNDQRFDSVIYYLPGGIIKL